VRDHDGLHVEVEIYGDEAAESQVEGIARRVLRPDWLYAMKAFEQAEERHFASLHGLLVRTGRLKRSLTRSRGLDALRSAHGNTALFGTRVPYARIAAHRAGHYVLVIDKKGRRDFNKRLLERMIHGAPGPNVREIHR
jgi:phage gpG-like protein